MRKSFLSMLIMVINLSICAHGAILTVGDCPEGYKSIQGAINSANDGDEIMVYPGTYFENIYIDKRLHLIGLKNPVIDAGGDYAKGPGVTILADGILMEGFTIRNSTNTAGDPLSGAGILVKSNNSIIRGNILENNYRSGIKVMSGYNNSFTNNSVQSNFEGILVADSYHNKIENNRLNANNGSGIFLTRSSDQNMVTDNVISNNSQGVLLIDAGLNEIDKNTFFGNKVKDVEIKQTLFRG